MREKEKKISITLLLEFKANNLGKIKIVPYSKCVFM